MVSIIIPVHNCEEYIDKCVRAVKAQTYTDWELILVDDASTDDSLEIMRRFPAEDARISVLSNSVSLGAGPTRNKGIDAARGEYIMFIDADDFPEPEMLEKLVTGVSGADLAICGYKSFVEGADFAETCALPASHMQSKDEVRSFFAATFPGGMAGYLWNKIYKSDIIWKNNIRFPDMRRLQDGMFNIEYFSAIDTCVIIPDLLYNYRLNPQTDIFRKIPKNYFSLIKRFTDGFINAASSWPSFSDERIMIFFLEESSTCIENALSRAWGMDKTERAEFLNTLRNDTTMADARRYIERLGKYRRFLLNHLDSQFLLHTAILTKTTAKKSLKKVFYFIKQR